MRARSVERSSLPVILTPAGSPQALLALPLAAQGREWLPQAASAATSRASPRARGLSLPTIACSDGSRERAAWACRASGASAARPAPEDALSPLLASSPLASGLDNPHPRTELCKGKGLQREAVMDVIPSGATLTGLRRSSRHGQGGVQPPGDVPRVPSAYRGWAGPEGREDAQSIHIAARPPPLCVSGLVSAKGCGCSRKRSVGS